MNGVVLPFFGKRNPWGIAWVGRAFGRRPQQLIETSDKTVERIVPEDRFHEPTKVEALGQIAGAIAHDFNNLLGAISGFAQFLEEDLPAGSAERQYARRILDACRRGETITAQILMFAQSKADAKRPIDVGRVARNSSETLRGLVSPQTRFAFESDDAPMALRGDERQIVQLLVNLCANADAALAGRPGSVSICLSRVTPGAVDLHRSDTPEVTADGGYRFVLGEPAAAARYCLIRVRDDGPGIAREILPRIFEPFYSNNDRSVASGLALAVARRVVAAHRGGLCVESRLGAGSCFSVYLPLDDSITLQSLPASQADKSEPRGSERVLIIDDDVDICDMLSIGLDRLGYEVASVSDAEEALAEFREQPQAWDVIVTDQRMPGVDGLVLARKLKEIRADIKIILCTGAVNDGLLRQSDPALDALFVKPVAPQRIAAAIRSLKDGPAGK